MTTKTTTKVRTNVNKDIIKKLEQLLKNKVCVGFLHNKQHQGPRTEDMTNAHLAAIQEYGTSTIPSRPFMAASVGDKAEVRTHLSRSNRLLLKNPDRAMKEIGDNLTDMIKKTMDDWSIPSNSLYTIAKKPLVGDNPLIETGSLRDSVEYDIRPKGGDL